MIVMGIALLLIVPRPAAGILCIAFGSVGAVFWLVLWPVYKRKGWI